MRCGLSQEKNYIRLCFVKLAILGTVRREPGFVRCATIGDDG